MATHSSEAWLARGSVACVLGLSLVACGGPTHDEADILREFLDERPELPTKHGIWHRDNHTGLDHYGELFLVMHGHMALGYDEWRIARGYGAAPAWDPALPIPATAPHARRDTDNPAALSARCITPSWFTVEGGDEPDPHSGAKRLADFTSADQLGRSINAPGPPEWHTAVHNTIGGDMGDNSTAPLDPVFWLYHRTVDDVFRAWLEFEGRPYPAGSHE